MMTPLYKFKIIARQETGFCHLSLIAKDVESAKTMAQSLVKAAYYEVAEIEQIQYVGD
jgi:hypothetical protein